MKNAVKVLCFVLAVFLIGAGSVYFIYFWQKSDFEITDGVNKGTAIITSYIGDSVNIKIPNRVRGKKIVSIDKNAFKESNIISVELNKYITSVGKDAFYGCDKLESVDLKSVRSIGETAFADCKSLKKFVFPSTVEKIGISPFLYDENLTDVSFNNNKFFILEDGIIYTSDKKELVTVIPSKKIKEYVCPDSLEVIDDFAFALQTELSSFKYNNKIKIIKPATFINCTSLTNIEIPENIISIEYSVFTGTGIKSITVPDTVTKIDDNAFMQMNEKITIKTTENSTAYNFAKKNNFKLEVIK